MTNRRKRIRVMLVPTQTYEVSSYNCDLRVLRDRLNDCQECFEFVTLAEQPRRRPSGSLYRTGVPLKRNVSLVKTVPKANGQKTPDERSAAVSTYIEYKDAFQQFLHYAATHSIERSGNRLKQALRKITDAVHRRKSSEPRFDSTDLIIGVGAEVVVPDLEMEAEGTAEIDAYSCLSYWGEDDSGMDNNVFEPLNHVVFVSLRRMVLVFPEVISTDQPERARSLVSRYLVMNLAGYLGGRTFPRFVDHDPATGCLNENAWIGAERESYNIKGYCDDCLEAYERLPVANDYARWSADQIIGAVELMARLPDRIDDVFKRLRRRSFYGEFAVLTVATGIFSNLLLDVTVRSWDIDRDFRSVHYKSHDIAIVIASMAVLMAIGVSYSSSRARHRLP